jgi:hypothetical protein
MKYQRLTKEQLEELQPEFVNFLAVQTITATEWAALKKDKPEVAEQELDVFSDLIWEGVLDKVEYLEHFSPQHMFLFQVDGTTINLISIKIENKMVDITTEEGYAWLQANLMADAVNLFTSSKILKEDRNADIFALIKQGAGITKGELYNWFSKFVDA